MVCFGVNAMLLESRVTVSGYFTLVCGKEVNSVILPVQSPG